MVMVLALLALGNLAHCTTITWTNPAGGGWNTAANWNPNSVPGATDTAIITNAGVTVTLDISPTVGGIILGTNGAGKVTLSLNNQTLSAERAVDREPQRLLHGGQRHALRQHERGVEWNDWLDRRRFGWDFDAGCRQFAESHHRK